MPLNVRRLYTSLFLVLFALFLSAGAQTPPAPVNSPPQTVAQTQQPVAPTSGDIMRERISKAKAFIAVRNYNAAIYELENIRRESNDATLKSVVNVLLMNSYLEQGDYKRAQDFLTEFYTAQKANKPNAPANYMAVAAQIVKGARSRAERYKALGLSVSDRTLPLEATNDLEKMRETLELVITQSKDFGKDRVKTSDAMALIEEASSSRSLLARDDYDARRWNDVVADAREEIANPGRVVMDATGSTPADVSNSNMVAANTSSMSNSTMKPLEKPPVMPPPVVVNNPAQSQNKVSNDQTVAANDKPAYVPMPSPAVKKEEPKKEESKTQPEPPKETPATEPVNDGSPMQVGPLLAYAVTKTPVIVPQIAKLQKMSGEVKVELTVDENGSVAKIDKMTGPSLLQGAAKDAVKKWKFKPFLRNGRPVQAAGFVSFNFAL